MNENSSDASHEQWMGRALELAAEAARAGEVPVGAVLVRDGQVLGEGFNQPISSNDPTAHAEIVALRDASRRVGNYRLSGSTLYVSIEPCTMCVGAMIHARVSTLVFGAREPRAGAVLSHLGLTGLDIYNHRIEVVEGVLAGECGEILRQFFKSRRASPP